MQTIHRLVGHDENDVGKLLRAGLQAERAGGRVVITGVFAVHTQNAIAAMCAKNEAGLQHIWKDQDAFSLGAELSDSGTLAIELIQCRSRLRINFRGIRFVEQRHLTESDDAHETDHYFSTRYFHN